MAKITEDGATDEVDNFVNCRYINAGEAAWKLFEFNVTDRSHSVLKMHCHLPNEQSVFFKEGEQQMVLERGEPETMLTAWFNYNRDNPDAYKVIIFISILIILI